MFDKWVIDASMSNDEMICIVPIDENLHTGFSYFCVPNNLPNNRQIVGIIHPDGQKAVEKWCEENKDLVTMIFKRLKEVNV